MNTRSGRIYGSVNNGSKRKNQSTETHDSETNLVASFAFIDKIQAF